MIELLLSDEQSFSVEDTNLSAFLKRPVRVNGGAVFLCTAGRAVVSVNVEEHAIECDTEVVLLPDMVFMLVEASADFRVIFYASSIQVFDGAMQRLDTECFHYLETHPAIRHRGETARGVKNLYSVVLAASAETENIYRSQIMYLLMRHILLNVCDKVRRNYIRYQEEGAHRKRELYDRFVKLIAEHFIERRDVAFYAGKLCISMSYLASVTRTLTGETPQGDDRQVDRTRNQTDAHVFRSFAATDRRSDALPPTSPIWGVSSSAIRDVRLLPTAMRSRPNR